MDFQSMALIWGSLPPPMRVKCGRSGTSFKVRAADGGGGGGDCGFPSFLPKEVEKIRDPFARNLAQRIERLPVQVQILVFLLLHCLLAFSVILICTIVLHFSFEIFLLKVSAPTSSSSSPPSKGSFIS